MRYLDARQGFDAQQRVCRPERDLQAGSWLLLLMPYDGKQAWIPIHCAGATARSLSLPTPQFAAS